MEDTLIFGLLVAGLGVSITTISLCIVIITIKILTKVFHYEEITPAPIESVLQETDMPLTVIIAAISSYLRLEPDQSNKNNGYDDGE